MAWREDPFRRSPGCLLCIARQRVRGAGERPAGPSATVSPSPVALRYVALGDSYTIGTSVAADERWPDQLVAGLAADPPAGGTLDLVANHAVNGYTAGSVLRRQLPRLDDDAPIDFATLLVGVNDVVQGVPEATYRADVDTILEALLERLPPGRILCIETPDYTVTPQGAAYGDPAEQRAGIVRVNEILRERCGAAHIRFVDGIFAISEEAATDRDARRLGRAPSPPARSTGAGSPSGSSPPCGSRSRRRDGRA